MTKDEIYEHLAQVYLGKREKIPEKKKFQIDVQIFMNTILVVIILVSVVYGMSAFLSRKGPLSHKNIIFALSNSPIRIQYNLNYPYPQVSGFSVPIPKVNAGKYEQLSFSVRGLEEGYPSIIKVVVHNRKKETSFYLLKGVGLKWQRFNIPFSEFSDITDWSNITDVSFVFEAWNINKKKGIILIDDLCFST